MNSTKIIFRWFSSPVVCSDVGPTTMREVIRVCAEGLGNVFGLLFWGAKWTSDR